MRGDGLKVRYSAGMSTTFRQLFSLFLFSVDSQGFIAEDFFSISQNEPGKRERIKRNNHQGKHLRNLFIHFEEFTQHTRGNRKQATDIISA